MAGAVWQNLLDKPPLQLGLRGIEWAIFDAEGLTKPRIT
jgi:hypothetical protein